MPKKFFLLAICLLVFCLPNQTKAQTSIDLVARGDAVEQTLKLLNTGASIANPEFEVVLPAGVSLSAGSIDLMNTNLSGRQYSLTRSTATGFVITLNGTFNSSETAWITFKRVADCVTGVITGPEVRDKAFIVSNPSVSVQSEIYTIWEPIMYLTGGSSLPAGTVIAGQDVEFSFGLRNSGLNSYVSEFYIAINHAGFNAPTSIKLQGVNTLNIEAASIITVDADNVRLKVTPAMLSILGFANGRVGYSTGKTIDLTFNATPKIASCGSLSTVKISTQIAECSKVTTEPLHDVSLTITSPGTVLASFTAERINFDFPDAAVSRTINGAWSRDGGSANPVKDQVRNGDTLELRLKGNVYTSSLLPEVGLIYVDVYAKNAANADTYSEFNWSQTVTIRAKNALNQWVESVVIADVIDNNGYLRYKVAVSGNTELESGEELELVIAAVMKSTATDTSPCTISAEMYATASQGLPESGYPIAACRNVATGVTIKRVVVSDALVVETSAFTASCSVEQSSVKFSSSELSSPSVVGADYFTQEFRSNHYVKELQVYVPAEATLQGGRATFNEEATSVALTIPSYETVSFIANVTRYDNAKCYTFDLSALYGSYGSGSSKFIDELTHNLLFEFDVEYGNVVGGGGQVSSILYVATPVNPSAPDAILETMSAVQTVLHRTISPELTVSGESNVSISNGKVLWTLSLNNANEAADVNNASLKIESLTGGTFSSGGLAVTLNGTPVTVSGDTALLGNIAHNTTNTIVVEATIDQACSKKEEVAATLMYESCGAVIEEIETVQLSFTPPLSTIVVASSPSSSVLEMCQDFTVRMVISVPEGIVENPKAVLEFPKNSSGGIGITYLGIVEVNGVDHTGTLSGYYEGEGVTARLENVEFDLGKMTGGVSMLAAGTPNNEFELVIRLRPNCDFPVNAKLTSYVYGNSFCKDGYNSVNSGTPFYTDILEIDGLQSAYKADVKFSEAMLTFDKVLNEKTTTLSIKKSSGGGDVGADDVISLTMPLAFRLKSQPDGFIAEDVTSSARVVTWRVPMALSSTDWTDYNLTFVIDNPAAYTDSLKGSISAVVINKIEGLACGPLACSDVEAKAGEGMVNFEIIDLFPALAKDVSYKANSLLSYTFTYAFTLRNFGALPINNIRLEDDLSAFYSKGNVGNINVTTSSAGLVANSSYNGRTDIQLLASASELPAYETQTVTLTFNILFSEEWKNKTFTISNTAIVIGSNDNGTDYEDTSNNGTEPDLTDDTPTDTDDITTTPPEVEVVPIVTVPPPGFAIAADGVECFEGDSGTTTPLEFGFRLKDGLPLDYNLCFTVFSRDSIATIVGYDYERLLPTTICIEAGSVTANETVTITIIGDDKYEKDEPLILDVKPGADAMTCKPPIITILNDDDKPEVVIDNIILEGDEGAVAGLGDYSQPEGTSTIQLTIFKYCVRLNIAAPQAINLKVRVGGNDDAAVKGDDYYLTGDVITVPIAEGEDEACFEIEVNPDNTPENDEYFTIWYSLEAENVTFYEEAKKTVILNDDSFNPSKNGDVLAYCPGDDTAERLEKLAAYIVAPTGYEFRWYTTQIQEHELSADELLAFLESLQSDVDAVLYLGVYIDAENYLTPKGERVEVAITVQSQAQITLVSTPGSPITLLSGQSVLFEVEEKSYTDYSFTLNGTTLAQAAGDSESSRMVYKDRFIYTNPNPNGYTTNTIDVEVVDANGCTWNDSLDFEVQQVELPNAFIPEGSNPDNQIFLKGYDIKVFNRWGHLLYEGTEGWDGRYKGSYVAAGTYFYVVYIEQEDGSVVEEKGFVMVVSATKR